MKENVRKFEKTLREDEELRARFAAEFKRIAEEKIAGSDAEAYVKAAKALGVDLSLAEVEKASAETQELDLEEMGKAAGGWTEGSWCFADYACYTAWNHDSPDEEGFACFTNHNCLILLC